MAPTRYYNLYLVDGTKPSVGFDPAPTYRVEHVEESSDSNRPSLEHVLLWIDSQAPGLRDAEGTMRNDPGTATLYLEARLPIESGNLGAAIHKYLGNEVKIHFVSEIGVDELKKRVTAVYTSA